jgi:beta-lactamase class D
MTDATAPEQLERHLSPRRRQGMHASLEAKPHSSWRVSPFRSAAFGALLCLLASPVLAAPVWTLVVEAANGAVLDREGAQCETRTSPASTFKLALAVMGYDAGILSDAHAPAWPYKEEYAAWMDSWRKTVDPTSWLRDSVVWYSREITRRLGAERFQDYVDRLGYGNRDLSGDPGRNNGLTNAWLSSSLMISPAEQVGMLRRLLSRRLPVSSEAQDRTVAIVPQFPLPDGWTVHGKTGNGFQPRPNGTPDRDRQFGWFVGWAEKADRTVVFARLLKDDAKIEQFASVRARDGMLADLPGLLEVR